MTRQVKITDKWRKMSSGKYSREWRHSAGHFSWLRIRSIIVCILVSNLLVIKEKYIKIRSRAFGVRYSRNAICGHCVFVLILGDK